MARDGTIPTGKLIELLVPLPIASRVVPNELGNLICYGEDKYLGYIDIVTERFHSIQSMAYEMLERDDEDNDMQPYRTVHSLR